MEKRWVLYSSTPATRSLPAADAEKRFVVPGLDWTDDNKLAPQRRYVVHGAKWNPDGTTDGVVIPRKESKPENVAKRYVVHGVDWKEPEVKRAVPFTA